MSSEAHVTHTYNRPVGVLALNPAVDISYEIAQLVPDQKVRSSKTHYHPGGNGINVARALAELGMPQCCFSIIGGESGSLLLRLLGDTLGGDHHHFPVEGETRLNATLLQKSPPSQFEVESVGPEVPPEILAELAERFLEICGEGLAVLTGSTPPGVPEDTYRRLAERVREGGGRAVVDVHGPVLKEALRGHPFLVRLNRYVLEMSVKQRLSTLEAVAEAARGMQRAGVDLVCISLGGEGAILVDGENSYHCPAPKVRVNSTVGCGDALLAGMVAAHHRGDPPREMLRFGVLCGSMTASYPGTALFTRDQVETIPEDLEVQDLDI